MGNLKENAVKTGYFERDGDFVDDLIDYTTFCVFNKRPLVVLDTKKKYTVIVINSNSVSEGKVTLKPEVASELNDILDKYVELDFRSRQKVNSIPENRSAFKIENLSKDVVYDFLGEMLPILFSGWEEVE